MQAIGTLCLGALLVIGLLIAWFVLSKLLGNKEPPAGTYNDKKIDSGGSIGGMRGGRSYDSPKIDSGGSIGGAPEHRAHDHPDIDSGGSIGGGPSVGKRPGSSGGSTDSGGRELGGNSKGKQADTGKDTGRVDHPDIKSGGSFGG